MSIPAESAVRAWINALPIVGDGNPLSRGAYLREQRSPADGAYAVIMRTPQGVTAPVAEDDQVDTARMTCTVYAGTEQSAEEAAAALMTAIAALNGRPEPCGGSGVVVLVTDNRTGPSYAGFAPEGENHAFQVGADFVLTTG